MRWLKKSNVERVDPGYFLFVAPLFALFVAFFIFPALRGLWLSFTDFDGIKSDYRFVGLDNYIRIIARDKSYWASYGNTIIFTLVFTLGVNAVALTVAILLDRGSRLDSVSRLFIFLPNVLNYVVIGTVWFFILGKFSTYLAELTGWGLFRIGWISDPRIAIYSAAAVAIWNGTGWFMLIYLAALQSIPGDVIEAARVDGSAGLHTFYHIKLPFLWSAVSVSLFIGITRAMKEFGLIYSMTGGGPGGATQTVLINIYDSSFSSMRYGYGIAKSMLLILVLLTIGALQMKLTGRKEIKE